MTDNILNEVDADVRAEQLHKLWLQYRFKLLLLVVAIILASVGSTLWQNYQEKRGGELLLQLNDAQALYIQHHMDESAAAFEKVTQSATGDVLTLAQLWQARALTAAGKKPEAIAVLKIASAGSPTLWTDLACLRLASLDMDAAKECLVNKKESPLTNQRREWQAANLWANGQKDEAIALLEQLQTSPDTSDATRTTTAQWLATMRAENAAPATDAQK